MAVQSELKRLSDAADSLMEGPEQTLVLPKPGLQIFN